MKISNFKLKNFLTSKFLIVIFILTIALFLRIYKLNDLMMFIGDFAWFYISARDMLLTGNIPLVGITSSHTWVHQGPLWTYILAIPLLISNFNPLSGAYLTAIAGTVTVFFIYKIGTQMFSKFVGVAASALYATSPLVIIHSRMPYHTSIIPLMTLLFVFFIYKWVKGDIRFLPFVFFALGVLYNLELATMVFWILLLIVFVYGVVKRESWFREAINFKIILMSVFSFLLPMLPMIIYDINKHSGFYQITAFLRLAKTYLFSPSHTPLFEAMPNIFSSLFIYNQRLVFLANGTIAFLLTVISFFYLLVRHSGDPDLSGDSRIPIVHRDSGQARMTVTSLSLLGLWIGIPIFGIIISRTASEAYIPMLFPAIILSIAFLFNYFYKRKAFITLAALIFLVVTNGYLLVAENYLMGKPHGYGTPFSKILKVSEKIVKESDGKKYNLIPGSKGIQLESFEYLTWWLEQGYTNTR